ncbi:hypothetical protein DPMN_058252 [Dreissena polymorpha]|uniref:Uncharacterized protein n=1 Tax=Dreissena polymorpha TaxID=45954 RepID=A0A9D4C1E4_DREPO|nr:hypothetical protein DPMN_058252 [Dreissena polymorpha]
MDVPLTSKVATLTSVKTSMTSLGKVGDTSDMLDSFSPTSVPSFMTIGQQLCLQQRQNGSHYKECQPMTSLWRFSRKRLTGAARKRL